MFKKTFQIRSTYEQVADFLLDAIKSGELHGHMPGVHALAKEFGIHHTTAAEALSQLEREGYLKGAGAGKKRKILIPGTAGGVRLKVAILLYEPEDIGTEFINELRHQLIHSGHDTVVAKESLVELKFGVKRLKKLVTATRADVWLVLAGSPEVLEWFAEQKLKTFALFSGSTVEGVARSGPGKGRLMREIVQRLVKLHHRRIVLLIAEQSRKERPSPVVQAYLDEVTRQGLPVGNYNLPDWNHEQGSLQACLKTLFQVTPPTALIVDDPLLIPAVLQFLNQMKLSIPDDVSLLCLDGHPSFKWLQPALLHTETDLLASLRHAVRWVNRVAKGKADCRKHNTIAKFIEGGTIGAAKH